MRWLLICRVRCILDYRHKGIWREGHSHRNAVFLHPMKGNKPTSALYRIIGKPSLTNLFSSLGTVNARLESEYVM